MLRKIWPNKKWNENENCGFCIHKGDNKRLYQFIS
uniref:Uncharacterized protein n=1 Tax=Rhizophora mucronata TaxID=61149 RepID=A0A2P2QDV1_RHIMU